MPLRARGTYRSSDSGRHIRHLSRRLPLRPRGLRRRQDSGGGRANLNLWVFNEPSGAFTEAAKRCSDASRRPLQDHVQRALQRRRRSSASRSSAGSRPRTTASTSSAWTSCGPPSSPRPSWIKPWPRAPTASRSARARCRARCATATYKGRLWAAPANTNTQLLWYRKDLVKNPATTWDGLDRPGREAAQGRADRDPGRAVRGRHRLVQLARRVGRRHDRRGRQGHARAGRGRRPREIMHRLANSKAADPSLSAAKEDQNRARLRGRRRGVPGQLPLHLSERQGGQPGGLQADRVEALSRDVRRASRRRRRSAGSTGASARYTKHPEEAFEAAACLRNEENQRVAAIKGGLPPTLEVALRRPEVRQGLPVRRPDPRAGRERRRAAADARLRRRLAGDRQDRLAAVGHRARRLRRRPARASSRTRWTRRGSYERDGSQRAGRRDHARRTGPDQGTADRPRAGRAQARLDAVRARRARDARGDRVSDRLRGLPVAAARRPALPRRHASSSGSRTTSRSSPRSLWWSDVCAHAAHHGASRWRSSSCSGCCSRSSCTARSSAAA